jgi:nucleoid-associated protein YgaU
MRKDVKTGMFVGIGLVFVGWVLFALYSDTLQERRQKQLAGQPVVSEPIRQSAPSQQQTAQNPPREIQKPAEHVPPAPPSAPEKIHIVEAGQTLSSISTLYYGNGEQWQKIVEANSDILKNPSQLRPGMRLKIPTK